MSCQLTDCINSAHSADNHMCRVILVVTNNSCHIKLGWCKHHYKNHNHPFILGRLQLVKILFSRLWQTYNPQAKSREHVNEFLPPCHTSFLKCTKNKTCAYVNTHNLVDNTKHDIRGVCPTLQQHRHVQVWGGSLLALHETWSWSEHDDNTFTYKR